MNNKTEDLTKYMPQDCLEVHYKTIEQFKLFNRLHRYNKRLVKEGLQKACRENIEIVLTRCFSIYFNQEPSTIFLPSEENDSVNVDPLIKLVKQEYYSLYRRYYEGLKRYQEGREQLKELLEKMNARLVANQVTGS